MSTSTLTSFASGMQPLALLYDFIGLSPISFCLFLGIAIVAIKFAVSSCKKYKNNCQNALEQARKAGNENTPLPKEPAYWKVLLILNLIPILLVLLNGTYCAIYGFAPMTSSPSYGMGTFVSTVMFCFVIFGFPLLCNIILVITSLVVRFYNKQTTTTYKTAIKKIDTSTKK